MKSITVSRIIPQNKRTLLDCRMMKIEGDLIIFPRLYLVDVLAGVLKDRGVLQDSRGVKGVRMTSRIMTKMVPQNPRTILD